MQKQCPDCAEWIEGKARVCSHCRRAFSEDDMLETRRERASSVIILILIVFLVVGFGLWKLQQPGANDALVQWEAETPDPR